MNRSDVENVLLEIGIPSGVKGFKYITDAVLLIDTEEYRDSKFVAVLYPTIGKKYNTTGSRVERAIRHAFEIARNPKGNYEAVERYIGFINCTNSSSIKMLRIRIKQECEDKEKESEKQEKSEQLCGMGEDEIRRIVREEIKAIMGGI